MDLSIGELIAGSESEAQALAALVERGFTPEQAQFMVDLHYGRAGGDRRDAYGKPLPFRDLEEEISKRA